MERSLMSKAISCTSGARWSVAARSAKSCSLKWQQSTVTLAKMTGVARKCSFSETSRHLFKLVPSR